MDGLRDLLLSPVSIGFVLYGILVQREQPDKYFRRLMRFGRDSDHFINLFGEKQETLGPKPEIDEIDKEEAYTDDGAIFELGSGWGNLLIPLAKKYPLREIVGYELSPVPWLTCVIIKKILALKNLQVHRKNFLTEDLSRASVILCYLFPGGMEVLESKLNTGDGKLEYLISNNFALPSYKPSKTIQINDFYKSPVYLYEFKGKPVSGT